MAKSSGKKHGLSPLQRAVLKFQQIALPLLPRASLPVSVQPRTEPATYPPAADSAAEAFRSQKSQAAVLLERRSEVMTISDATPLSRDVPESPGHHTGNHWIAERPIAEKPVPDRRTRYGCAEGDPLLRSIWETLAARYFPEHPALADYAVVWSTRPQRRTLASCNIWRRRVLVAREMNLPEAHGWLEPLLYHEMCHAVAGFEIRGHRVKKRVWHGAKFRALESRHPRLTEFNHWVHSGGFAALVRRDRARHAAQARWGSSLKKKFP